MRDLSCLAPFAQPHVLKVQYVVHYPSFLLMDENYAVVWLGRSWLVHASADGHSGCFCLLAIVNCAMIIHVHVADDLFSGRLCSEAH